MRTVALSTEQNYNMINGSLNNAPAMSTRPPEKGTGQSVGSLRAGVPPVTLH
ncbi:hypothetical protein B5E67_09845 [Faecalibacterium sp. An122]|nr:hypothetical protein B5E67_09845 [Faecalibacterium sp. An122]